MHNNTRRRRVHAPFRLHSLAVAMAAASASTLAPLSAQAQAPETRDAEPSSDGKTTVLKTMKITADAESLNAGLPPADGFKADFQQSATKMPMTVRETPQSISVITRESLDVRQVKTLGQALELSAGVSQFSGNGPFAGQPSFGFNQTTIRGMSIDDLYDFRDDGFVSGSYFSQPDLAIYERIEVVKGPNSVLYGRSSVGGLINRVRKKPQLEAHTDLTATVGSYDTYRVDADVTGPMNDSKTLRGRMIGAYEDSGSFADGAETQRLVLAPSIDFDVTERTRLLVQANYQEEDIIPNTGMPLAPTGHDAEGRVTDLDAPDIRRGRVSGVTNREPYTWRISSLLAQLDHEFNDDWFATLRFSKTKINTPIEVDSYAYGFRDSDDPDTAVVERRGDTNLLGNDFDIERDVWSGEIQLNGRFDVAGQETKVAFGADKNVNEYYRRGIYYYTDGFAAPGTEYNIYDRNFEVPDRSVEQPGATMGGDPQAYGVYAQAQISVTERLKVLLGARFDEVELRAFDGDGPSDTQTVNDTTGRIGLTYDVNANISLYALYAQSFEPILYSRDIDGNLLDPERGEIREAGVKTEWFDGKLAASTAIYAIDREDMSVAAPRQPDVPDHSVPDGSQSADGFEIEINGQPLPGWDVSLAYNNVDVEYRNPYIPEYDTGLSGAAEWQLGLFTGYEIQNGPLRGLGAGVTRFEIDERGVSPTSRGKIPGYERYDLHAFYKGIKDIEINLTVRNVTDEVYVEGADRANAYAQFGSPTAALLSVKYTIN